MIHQYDYESALPIRWHRIPNTEKARMAIEVLTASLPRKRGLKKDDQRNLTNGLGSLVLSLFVSRYLG